MKKILYVLAIFLLFSCNQDYRDLKKIGEQYNEMVSASLEQVGSSFAANSELDIFPFYYEGADVSYESSNEESLFVEGTALCLNRKNYLDEYVVLKATLSLGEATVSYQYAVCILSAEMKMLEAPTVSLIRGGVVVDGFYLKDYDFQSGDQLRLVPPIGASCRYTLDGTQPTQETEAKELTFDLETGIDLNVKAIAVRDGYFPSPVLAVTGFVPGLKPTLSAKGNNLTLTMSKSLITGATVNSSNQFVNLETLENVHEEVKAEFEKLKASRYYEQIKSDYRVLNFFDKAIAAYEWPAKDLKDALYNTSRAVVQEANVEDSNLFFYIVKKEGAFAENPELDGKAFTYAKIAVADMMTTPSEDLVCPLCLSDSGVDYSKKLLFDSKKYLEAKGTGEKSVYVDGTSVDCGYIDESVMETLYPGWGDLMFSLSQFTVIVKANVTGGEGIKTIFSFTAATEVNKYLSTFYKDHYLGYEWRADANNTDGNAMENCYKQNQTRFIVQTKQNSNSVLRIGDNNAELSSFTKKDINNIPNNPTSIPYRAAGKLGKFSLGANNRFGNQCWRSVGTFHCRVYQGVLTDDQIQSVITEMNDTDYPMAR